MFSSSSNNNMISICLFVSGTNYFRKMLFLANGYCVILGRGFLSVLVLFYSEIRYVRCYAMCVCVLYGMVYGFGLECILMPTFYAKRKQ